MVRRSDVERAKGQGGRPDGAFEGLHPPATVGETGQRLKLVRGGSDAALAAHPAARIYVADDGGPLRTVVGVGHSHFVGEEHSRKTATSHPYEGRTEHALIVESELRHDVLAYRTQAFRMELLVGSHKQSWICDHLRQVRTPDGDVVEAIECKPDMSYITEPAERAKLIAASRIVGAMGWRFRLLYERDVAGGGERQINFGCIYANSGTHVPPGAEAAFERLCETDPEVTFGELHRALSAEPRDGRAFVHALVCQGRVAVDLDAVLGEHSVVRLLPKPEFTSQIDF